MENCCESPACICVVLDRLNCNGGWVILSIVKLISVQDVLCACEVVLVSMNPKLWHFNASASPFRNNHHHYKSANIMVTINIEYLTNLSG